MKKDIKRFIRSYREIYGYDLSELFEYVLYGIRTKQLKKVILKYIVVFNEKYNNMIKYNLRGEIKMSMENGCSFFEACEDWDI